MTIYLYITRSGAPTVRQGTYPSWAAALASITPDLCEGYWTVYVSSLSNGTIHLVIDL